MTLNMGTMDQSTSGHITDQFSNADRSDDDETDPKTRMLQGIRGRNQNGICDYMSKGVQEKRTEVLENKVDGM